MATRKWVAEDGEQFNTKEEVDAYEAKKPFLEYLNGSIGTGGISAESIYNYFDKNFRVPVKRTKRAAAVATPAPKLVAAVKKDGKNSA